VIMILEIFKNFSVNFFVSVQAKPSQPKFCEGPDPEPSWD